MPDLIKIHHGVAESLPYPDNHFDLLVTDPPYGYRFMGKEWDKAVVGVPTWKEVLRVLKPGAFGFIMSAPRQDVLSRIIVNLDEAGFETGFTSLYWAYATGFPKAANIGKAVDKRLGVEREVIRIEDRRSQYDGCERPSQAINTNWRGSEGRADIGDVATRVITAPASPLAKSLDGSYAGFQVKPAVEIILVVMKPLSERTYLEQAMKDGKGVTWLDAGRIPFAGSQDRQEQAAKNPHTVKAPNEVYGDYSMCRDPWEQPQGRFPANLLISDDVLDDGQNHPATVDRNLFQGETDKLFGPKGHRRISRGDSGAFSRYFDLDAWWEALPASVRQTYPFLVVPKATKAEKNRGCNNLENKTGKARRGNIHPTVKPVKLMAYLIAIGSRPGDLILDPFMGSGTTLVAAKSMGRLAVGLDSDEGCIPIARARVRAVKKS